MAVQLINPANGLSLRRERDSLADAEGKRYPILAGVPRICDPENYTSNFGIQWNAFRQTQIDSGDGQPGISERRFFAETAWESAALKNLDVLEVGSEGCSPGTQIQVLLDQVIAHGILDIGPGDSLAAVVHQVVRIAGRRA